MFIYFCRIFEDFCHLGMRVLSYLAVIFASKNRSWQRYHWCTEYRQQYITNQLPLDNTLYLRCSATKTLLSANGFSPRKVVQRFNSDKGISKRSFAIHSSAKELETTFTPVKSKTTFSPPLISAKSFCRSF